MAPRTVSKWFDSGQLKGYRIPGSKDRRIPVHELVRFMKAHDMPATAITAGSIRVMIVDSDSQASEALAEGIKAKADYDVQTAESNFETGVAAQKFAPHVLLINLLADGIDAADICSNIRGDEDLQTIKIIAMANKLSDSESQALLQKGFDGYVSDGADVSELIKKIEETTAIIY